MPSYGPPPRPYARAPSPPRGYREYDREDSRDDYLSNANTRRCASNSSVLKRGEQVEVRIRGNVWIVGFLVSSLHLISSYLGLGYDVEYTDKGSHRMLTQAFNQADVRPYTG